MIFLEFRRALVPLEARFCAWLPGVFPGTCFFFFLQFFLFPSLFEGLSSPIVPSKWWDDATFPLHFFPSDGSLEPNFDSLNSRGGERFRLA